MIDGHYTQGASGVLTMALGEVSDRIVIDGDASFAGMPLIRFVDGFVPTLGQTFELITYRSHTGSLAFRTVGEAARPHYVFALAFGEQAVTLQITALAPPVPESASIALRGAGLGTGAVGARRRTLLATS